MYPTRRSSGNRLLDALSQKEFEALGRSLECVALASGKTLHEPGVPIRDAYFPVNAVVSLLHLTENGNSVAVAVVGNDGLVGLSLFLGGDADAGSAIVQSAGSAYRVRAGALKQALDRTGGRRSNALHPLLLRYTQSLLIQTAQTAVCNRHHSLDQQLCRWLLLALDRLPSNELVLTQELIAKMLGVRREGVTEAAGNLQKARLIQYQRGHITVLDRSGLEARSCECYAVVRNACRRLLQLPK